MNKQDYDAWMSENQIAQKQDMNQVVAVNLAEFIPIRISCSLHSKFRCNSSNSSVISH